MIQDKDPSPMMRLAPSDVVLEPLIRAALSEDLGRAGDITAQAVIPNESRMTAHFRVRKDGVIAGLNCARLSMSLMDPKIAFGALVKDGDHIKAGTVLATVEGPAHGLLAAERTALNLLCRASGIATLTKAYLDRLNGLKARLVSTRKTTPLWRALEKYAVSCGGGTPHRYGLDDAILIKDNHIAICGGVSAALTRAMAFRGHLTKVEIEVDGLAQLREALPFRPNVIMLDNFSLDDMRAAVKMVDGAVTLEASGGVNLETIRAIAETGVDVISVGALTHSAPILDIGLDAI